MPPICELRLQIRLQSCCAKLINYFRSSERYLPIRCGLKSDDQTVISFDTDVIRVGSYTSSDICYAPSSTRSGDASA